MNEYLTLVSTWLALNKLSLNVTKTVYITFGIYYDSIPTNMNIRIGNKNLKRVGKSKYLGLTTTSNGTYMLNTLLRKRNI